MKNPPLAQWLQDHTDMFSTTKYAEDSAFHAALFENLIDMVLHGQTHLIDSILESAATHAVGVGRGLTNLLRVPQALRARIWQRIGEEVDPEPAFGMLTDLDEAFVHIIRTTIDAYEEATKLTHAAKAVEISRLYSESEQKVMRFAAEVSRGNRELARLEQAKTDFISIAAHELKTPLTLIQGYVNILEEMDLNDQAQSLIKGIERGTRRMGVILNDMLDLSAIDTQQLSLVFEQVNINHLIELIRRQIEATLQDRKQRFEIKDLETLPVITADIQRIHQIFKQIINNAIKYTPDEGCIIVSGSPWQKSHNGQTDQIKVTVRDTGVGIAPEDRDRIFDKFYRAGNSRLHSTGQTKFMGAGPGLGLAIAKGLIEAHGGQIWAESPGFDDENLPGSTFHVVLPVEANLPPGVTLSE